jgi:hypothetical protein
MVDELKKKKLYDLPKYYKHLQENKSTKILQKITKKIFTFFPFTIQTQKFKQEKIYFYTTHIILAKNEKEVNNLVKIEEKKPNN